MALWPPGYRMSCIEGPVFPVYPIPLPAAGLVGIPLDRLVHGAIDPPVYEPGVRYSLMCRKPKGKHITRLHLLNELPIGPHDVF